MPINLSGKKEKSFNTSVMDKSYCDQTCFLCAHHLCTMCAHLSLIAEIFDETVGVIVSGIIEGIERGEIVQVAIVLITHVISHAVPLGKHCVCV